MFEWSDSYSVGIRSVDLQHQKLFGLAEELHVAMTAGKAKAALGALLANLTDYTAVHFSYEEQLMRQHNYPGIDQHIREHEKLKQQIVEFQQDFEAGVTSLSVDLMLFLRNWLQKHIKGTDTKYAPHLRDRAVA